MAPTIDEVYEIRGILRSADPTGQPVAGAQVTAFYRNAQLASATTNQFGCFFFSVPREKDAIPKWVPDVWGGGYGTVVKHNYGAIQRHEHWHAEVRIIAAGFEKTHAVVEVPRPADAEPTTIFLRRAP